MKMYVKKCRPIVVACLLLCSGVAFSASGSSFSFEDESVLDSACQAPKEYLWLLHEYEKRGDSILLLWTRIEELSCAMNEKEEQLKGIKADSLCQVAGIQSKERQLDVQKSKIDSLGCKVDNLLEKVQREQHQRHSLEMYLAFADTCVGRFCNARLFERYDSVLVSEAIGLFPRIRTEGVKSYFEPVLPLLKSYEESFKQFVRVLEKYQELLFPGREALREMYLEDCKSEIMQLPYYQKYYNADWSIPWLNDQIDLVLKRVEDCLAGQTKSVDFSDLLDLYD